MPGCGFWEGFARLPPGGSNALLPMKSGLDLAYEHCRRIAKEHARNFYYAFRTLPSRKRKAIYAAYAFCRACDDVADDDLPVEEKRRLLAQTRERLAAAWTGEPEDRVLIALKDAVSSFGIPTVYFDEIIEGVEMDLTVSRFRDFCELRTYCYRVASVVGLVCIEVFGFRDESAKEFAVDLGLAMQLTNIMRDVKEDAERGRIYLPQDEMEDWGYTEAELMNGVVNAQFRGLMGHQAERARRYFDSGRRLVPLLDRESRACAGVLHTVYSALLDRIEGADYDVFERRIGVSTAFKLFIMARLWAGSLTLPVPILRR